MVHTGVLFGSALLGAVMGWGVHPMVDMVTMPVAAHVASIFKNLLSLVSLPLIFLSIVSAFGGMESRGDVTRIGGRVARYTFLTTIIAAAVGALAFYFFMPFKGASFATAADSVSGSAQLYWDFLKDIVPSNLVMAFSGQGGVMALVFLGVLFGFGLLSLEVSERKPLVTAFSSLFSLMIAITRMILQVLPVAVWAFMVLLVQGMQAGHSNVSHLGWYFLAVIAANVVQGFVVLPLFLWWKGKNPIHLFSAFQPALTLAFLSKSSNMTLPVTLTCAKERAGISSRIAQLSLPLCSTINMNGCAAFIIITILFVAGLSGLAMSLVDVGVWIVVATLAAVGNAGVPMGCFFLASAFLVHMGLPVEIMGAILPLYTFLDMVETALNVWSDACVTAVVDSELQEDAS